MSAHGPITIRLSRPVDSSDHVLGEADAPITLVEYGSYACTHCRAANERITEIREQFGERIRYVFRHRPVANNEMARRAAELVECIDDPEEFWSAHVALMSHSKTLTEADIALIATEVGLEHRSPENAEAVRAQAKARVDRDVEDARQSGVMYTPTFFINGVRYDGPWDEASFSDAMMGSLGHRVRVAALSFASWAPSAGLLLLLATVLAVVLTNTGFGPGFVAFWERPIGLFVGDWEFELSLLKWINDGLLTVFFLVVGLEIKREFTVGSLANPKAAALPIAAALGGMVVPALLYVSIVPNTWAMGWGVPIATDTAFAIALMAILGQRVPVELRVFLTAAAIVDDIGAIAVVAVFYSNELHLAWMGGALVVILLLFFLNYASIYNTVPYLMLGLVLWFCVHEAGIHATLAGVILAAFIPTRQPPNYRALLAQADGILNQEARHGGEQFRLGPSIPVLRAIDAIHDRMESPADRMLRTVAPRSSYLVLPIFALANAGVVMSLDFGQEHNLLMLAIFVGLVVGKPIGYVGFAWLAVRASLARKPAAYDWPQMWGAGALGGIGFTMSLFIAGQSFAAPEDFAAAKIAVFAASIVACVIGMTLLLRHPPPVATDE